MKDKNIKSFREFNENLNISDVMSSKKSFNVSDDEIEVGDYCIMTNDFGDKYLVEVIKKIKREEVVVRLELNNMENICHQNQLKKVVK
mgnify:FL=1